MEKLSRRLIKTERRLGLQPEDMAYILRIKEQMYRLYRIGDWDKTHSIRKDRMNDKLNALAPEIKSRVKLLNSALKKYDKKNDKNR